MPAKSVIPVRGLQIARIPATCGSISRIRSGPTSSSPSTPFASPARAERGQARQLCLVEGHDQLAGKRDRDGMCLAVPLQESLALPAQQRLLGARCVVQAGVHHPGVVARLVGGDAILFLEHCEAEAGALLEEPERRREAHDAGTDDGHVHAFRRRGGPGEGIGAASGAMKRL